jgi:hypothetical protein
MDQIDSFTGDNFFLSNFYPACIKVEGIAFPTVEHAYQYAKTLIQNEQIAILTAPTPGAAKRLGKTVTLRADWEMIKEEVMRKCLSQKFAIPELGTALLATGTAELIEGNSWGDTYWGVCNHAGQNRLGELLMQERSKARMDIDPDILKEYYLRRNELDYFFEYLDANGYDVEAFMEKNEARLDKLANQLDLAIADLLDNLIEADAEGII